MSIKAVTVKNGTTGPDYDVIGDEITKGAVTGIAQLNATMARRRDIMNPISEIVGALNDAYMDANGRLHVTPNAMVNSVTGSIVAAAGTINIPCASATTVYAYTSGTYTGITLAFEASVDDGVTWHAVNGHTVQDGAVGLSAVVTNSSLSVYIIPTYGADRIRVRASAFGTGSMSVQMRAMSVSPHVAAGTGGSAATDGVVVGNPIYNGAKASNVVPTAMSADADLVPMWADRNGALVSINHERCIKGVATPALTATPYSVGDQMGIAMTFTGMVLAAGRAGKVVNVMITDRSKQKASLTLWLFVVTPILVGADNALFDVTDPNLEASLPFAFVDFLAADYRDTVSGTACMGRFVNGMPEVEFVTTSTANIFGVLVSNGTPTYAGPSDILIQMTCRQM
jgi:hypothetical protein